MSDHFRFAKVERLEPRLLLAVTTGTDALAAIGHVDHSQSATASATNVASTTIAASTPSTDSTSSCSPTCTPFDTSPSSVAAAGTTGTSTGTTAHNIHATADLSPALSTTELNGIVAALHGAAHSQIMAALDQAHLHGATFDLANDQLDPSHSDTTDAEHESSWLLTSGDHHGSAMPDDPMAGASSGHTMTDDTAPVPSESDQSPAVADMANEEAHDEISLPGIDMDAGPVAVQQPSHLATVSDDELPSAVDEEAPAVVNLPTVVDAGSISPQMSVAAVTELAIANPAPTPPLAPSAVDLTMVAMRPELSDPLSDSLSDSLSDELAGEVTAAAAESELPSRWLGIAIAAGASLVAGALELGVARQRRTDLTATDPQESDERRQLVLRLEPRARIG
ncbi:MAG: hypothetical protein U0795_17465 [Pirellulales bacterium]